MIEGFGKEKVCMIYCNNNNNSNNIYIAHTYITYYMPGSVLSVLHTDSLNSHNNPLTLILFLSFLLQMRK